MPAASGQVPPNRRREGERPCSVRLLAPCADSHRRLPRQAHRRSASLARRTGSGDGFDSPSLRTGQIHDHAALQRAGRPSPKAHQSSVPLERRRTTRSGKPSCSWTASSILASAKWVCGRQRAHPIATRLGRLCLIAYHQRCHVPPVPFGWCVATCPPPWNSVAGNVRKTYSI